jgi:integrase
VLRYEHTSAIRDWLAATHKARTAASYMAYLRGVLKECWRLEWMTTDSYMRAIDLDAITGSTESKGRHVEVGEVRALFEHLAQDARPIARRDAAALALLAGAGVRRAELARLNFGDLDNETGRLVVGGKGGKERVEWLPPTALPAVLDWLAVRGDQPGPLLNPILKGGRLLERAMTPQAVRDICCKLNLAVSTAAATPRDWRATWSGATRQEVTNLRAAARLSVPYVPPRAA